MKTLRAAVRLPAVVAVTLASLLAVGLGRLTLRSRRGRGRWALRVFSLWSRGAARVLGLRVDWRGTPPRTPFLLVSNHLSYLDVITLGTRLPVNFVARGDLDGWPGVGLMCRAVDTIFLDRGRKTDVPRALRDLERAWSEGRSVVVFPEGTSSGGESVLPFRAPLLDLAVRLRLPVHYAALSYRTLSGDPPASEAVCWWRDMPFGPHVVALLKLRAIEARVEVGPEPIHGSDRKVLAEQLWSAVSARFVAVDSWPPDCSAGQVH